mgnify:CR=1 FL=1
MKKYRIILFILEIFLLTGCDVLKNDAMEDIEVYTTTYPTTYLINYLYGPHSNLHSIYPTGVNFKEYDLSEKKIAEYSKSDLFVFNSQDIDRDYAVKMINENKKLKLIDTAYGMNYDYAPEELWLNPYNYLMMGKNAKDSLSDYITNPYLVEEINSNYEKLKYDLSKLDAKYKETISTAKYTTIVADKDLFKYLEKYNIEVISLEENIITLTIKENDKLSDISNKYNVTVSDILTYNNKTDETLKVGETIKIPIKTIESSDLNKVKKLINENKIKYIYSDNTETNDTVKKIIEDNKLELVNINTMYSIDGGVSNNNEDYLTIMNENLELLNKELNR